MDYEWKYVLTQREITHMNLVWSSLGIFIGFVAGIATPYLILFWKGV